VLVRKMNELGPSVLMVTNQEGLADNNAFRLHQLNPMVIGGIAEGPKLPKGEIELNESYSGITEKEMTARCRREGTDLRHYRTRRDSAD
jgi:hypothetical protein